MFDGLSNRLGNIFDRLKRRGTLSEDDVNAAMREIRIALIESDVALPVVKDFVTKVREAAVGQDVYRSITPGQMVVKIVHDALVEMLGQESESISLEAAAPVVVLMVGLQGSGKTTTTGKIAKRIKEKLNKKVLLASLDTRRPAAQEQLKILGDQISVDSLPIIAGQQPEAITARALDEARRGGYDVLFLDTAGRLSIDEELMAEVARVRDLAKPHETLLVADAMTGQDAVGVAERFNNQVGITGIVLTRIDGDAKGGAALSMRAVTGKPIKLLGVGEKLDALEPFHPDRLAGRILGMGDVVSMVEKAAEAIDQQEAEKLASKMMGGSFTLEDMADQMRSMKKLGSFSSLLGLMPGMGQLKDMVKDDEVQKKMDQTLGIINSMTKKERRDPKLINASRKRRIATGSGVTVQAVNLLLKQHQDMADMMKKMKKMGKRGMLGGLGGLLGGGGLGGLGGLMGGGGMPDMAALQKMMGQRK